MVKFGFEEDPHVRNTLVHMYCCCCQDGSSGPVSAKKVFDESPVKDSVTWSAMIGGYARAGNSARAVTLFREMQVIVIKLNYELFIFFFFLLYMTANAYFGRSPGFLNSYGESVSTHRWVGHPSQQ